jgi:cation transport protein ChaC
MHDGDLWVFAYGSLIWRPGFAYVEAHRGTLAGFRRRASSWRSRRIRTAPAQASPTAWRRRRPER